MKFYWKTLSRIAILTIILFVTIQPAIAANHVVTTNADTGEGSLRDAISIAETGDTIDCTAISGTINLNSALPEITENLTITGPGADTLTLDGQGSYRSGFNIAGLGITVNISGFCLQNGYSDNGGAIYIANNSSPTLNISDCVIQDNEATAPGGGIYINIGAILNATNCSIKNNSAADYGGGICNYGGSMTVTSSTISGNSTNRQGGGIFGYDDTSTIISSTISDNTSSNNGGGIFVAGTSTISSCTISGNHCDSGDEGNIMGGGINLYMGGLTVRNTIIAHNYRGSGSSTGDDYYYKSGTLTDGGYNVVEYQAGDSTGEGKTFTAATNYIYTGSGNNWSHDGGTVSGTLGLSSSLADNGGPTQTLALDSGSFAAASETTGIPYGSEPHWNDSPETDQRGVARTADQNTSIGAYSANYISGYYYRSNNSGSWSNAATWEQSLDGSTGWASADAAPDETSLGVTILNGHTVTVDTDTTTDQTTVASGGALSVASGITLTIANGEGVDLTVEGELANSGSLTCNDDSTVSFTGGTQTVPGGVSWKNLTIAGTDTKTLGGDATVGGALNLDSTLAAGANTLTLNGTADIDGTLTVSTGTVDANDTFDATGGSLTFTDTGNLNLGGTVTSLGTLTPGTATVAYDGAYQTVPAATYNNLAIAGVSDTTKTLAGAVTANGNLSIGAGTTLDVSESSHGLSVGGDWTNNGYFTQRNGTVTFNGSAPQIITGASSYFYNLTISNTVDASSATSLGAIFQLAVNSGTFTSASDYYNVSIASGATLELSGDITVSGTWNNGGTFTHNNHKVTFDGTTSGRTITANGSNGIFDDISFTGSNGEWTLQDEMIVSGTFEVTNGVFISGAHTVTLQGTSATYSNANITVANTTWTGGTLNIQSDAAQTLPTGEIYTNLTLGRSAGSGTTLFDLLDSNPTINGTLTVDSEARIKLTPSVDTANNKSYDGTTTATVTLTDNHLSGKADDYILNYSSATFDSKDVGSNKTVNATGISLSGNDAGKYSLGSTSAAGTADITQAALTITPDNQSKVQGETFTFDGDEFTTSGLQNSETIGSCTIISDGAASTAAVGTHQINISDPTGGTFTASNYDITYNNGTFTVSAPATHVEITGPTAIFKDSLGSFTLSALNASDVATNVTENTVFDLTSNSSGTALFYNNVAGTAAVSQITIPSGSSSVNFYYRDDTAGSPTLTAARTSGMALGSDTHEITVNENLSSGGSVMLPVTGQTTQYKADDDGALEKGITWPIPRFTDNGDGTITDNLTGLIWLKKANLLDAYGNATWSEALDFVKELNSTGKMAEGIAAEVDAGDTSNGGTHQTDWRLPNRNEFESIMTLEPDSGTANIPTWLIAQGFVGVSNTNRYWTSTTYPPTIDYPGDAWHAQLSEGRIRHWGKEDYSCPVMVVRGDGTGAPAPVWKTGQTQSYGNGDDGDLEKGTAWPDPRFTDNGDGTVTDNLTNLVWLKKANCPAATVGWDTAFTYIAELNTSGTMNGNSAADTSANGSHQTDWRLPNRKELFSLLDQSRLNPALIAGHPFEDVQPEWYWSSSTDDLNDANAWAISMGSGSVSRGSKTTGERYVWAVRQAYYRSKQTGNWSDTATWEQSEDGLSWANAAAVPGRSHAGITIRSGHTVTVDGDISIDQTSLENGATLSVNDGVTLTVADGSGADMDVNGELSLAGSAVVDCNGDFDATGGTVTFGGAGSLNLGGTITSLGTFTCGSGTVTLDGASQNLPGTNTFYNLSKTTSTAATLTFEAGAITTVTGALTLQGAAGQLLALRSSFDGTRWNINPQGSRTLAYLDVKDSNNTNAIDINAGGTGSIDSDNNNGWIFNTAPTVSTQAVTDITTSSATGNGTITDLGTANPTAYGVCWSTTLNPTTADANINQGATGSTGAFTANLTGLSAGTTYHVRAYATNTAGTSYGEDVSFTTTSPLPSPAWYTVTFNLDGKGTRTGGGALVQSIKGGSSASAPLVQANSGYSFTGWDQSFSNVQASMTVTAQYTTQTFTLSYTAGTGGTITGTSPQIVNRGASGSPVTASPLAGYRFTGWNDGSKANPRTDTNVTSNISVKASFALLTYKLTVQAGTGDGAYAPGTVVSITADPASEGMIFDQWTGQTSNVANVNLAGTSLTMPASDVTVTAAYKEKPVEKFILTVNEGSGDGIYEAGTIVNISADSAAEGMIFDQWTDQTANVSNVNLADTSLTMPESDVAVTATYKEKPVEKFILTVTDGTGSGSYEAGTVISISASPAPEGMIFDQWTGHTANVANVNLANTSLTMPESDVTVTAAYKEKSMEKFMLAVTDGTGDGSYEAGEVVSISAGIAPKGMIFDKWTGQTATIANTNLANTSLTMPESDVTVTATYRQKPVEKFSLVVDSGTGDGEYKAGRIVTIAATPAEDGLIFHRWTGQTSNVSNVNIPNTTITMPGRSVRVRAVYKADPGASFVLQIRIQTQGDGVGTTLRSSTKTLRNGEERDETIPAGQLVVLTAPDPPEGYMFDKWTGQTEYITNINLPETTMYMPDADVVVIATYRPLQAEVDLSVLDGSGSGIYAPETIVPIMADPAPDGEMFDKWMGQTANVVNINLPETSLIMPGVDVAVQAVYCEMPGEIFELTVVNGSGSGSYPAASLVEVTADPAPEGYMFDKWMGQNATVDDIFNPETFVFMPPNEAMIIATYALSGDEPDDPDEPDENDTDQDGVLDAWEIANYEDILLDAEDYDAMDTDGDGYTDLEEYQRGTDIRVLDNLVTGYLVLMNDTGYTLSDGSRTIVYGSITANYLIIEMGATAECLSFPGENIFSLPSEAWLFTVSRSGATVTLDGPGHTRLVLPATTTGQTIVFPDGSAVLGIEDGNVRLGEQIVTTSASPVVTALETMPEITEHPSGDIENPDAYLLLTGKTSYTMRQGSSTEIYGSSAMNTLHLESGAAARLYSFSNANTFSIGADSGLFTVSRSGTTMTLAGNDGTLLIVGATLTPQQIRFIGSTERTLELVIESGRVMLGEQEVFLEPAMVE